jgi:hypothetical protein
VNNQRVKNSVEKLNIRGLNPSVDRFILIFKYCRVMESFKYKINKAVNL